MSLENQQMGDRYAVALTKNGTVIGHLPWKVSCVCSLFLRRGRNSDCVVTGTQRYSADLPQGGLKIPCKLLFTAKACETDKLHTLLK